MTVIEGRPITAIDYLCGAKAVRDDAKPVGEFRLLLMMAGKVGGQG